MISPCGIRSWKTGSILKQAFNTASVLFRKNKTMMKIFYRLIVPASIVLSGTSAHSQTGNNNSNGAFVVPLSPIVGDEIDSLEKEMFHLFPFWKKDVFISAKFYSLDADYYLLEAVLKDGSHPQLNVPNYQFNAYRQQVESIYNTLSEKQKTAMKKETPAVHPPATPADNVHVNDLVSLGPIVGDEIDSTEKRIFLLFPWWNISEFISARIYRADNDNYLIIATLSDGIVHRTTIPAYQF